MNELLAHRIRRVTEPGTLYNLGNALGFFAGLAAALVATRDPNVGDVTLWEGTAQYLAGSPAALALTTATVIFGIGGVVYSRAWANGAPPDRGLSRTGDLLSALGAICLACGLFTLGNPVLAASAGVLHAAGKLGSASGSERMLSWRGRSVTFSDLCKDAVLFSRVPAALSAVVGLRGDWLSMSVVACCLFWGTADWMLLSPHGLIRGRLRRA
jgi:hypothetical protein